MPQIPEEEPDGSGYGGAEADEEIGPAELLLGPGKIELETGAASDEDGIDEALELAAGQKLLYHSQYALSAAGGHPL